MPAQSVCRYSGKRAVQKVVIRRKKFEICSREATREASARCVRGRFPFTVDDQVISTQMRSEMSMVLFLLESPLLHYWYIHGNLDPTFAM